MGENERERDGTYKNSTTMISILQIMKLKLEIDFTFFNLIFSWQLTKLVFTIYHRVQVSKEASPPSFNLNCFSKINKYTGI